MPYLSSPDAARSAIIILGTASQRLAALGPIQNEGPLGPKLDHAAVIAEAVPHILAAYAALIKALAEDLRWVEPVASEGARSAVIDALEALAAAVKELLPSADQIIHAHIENGGR